MGIHDMPTELLVQVASYLDDDADVSTLVRASRQLYTVLDSYLYVRNAERYDVCKHGYGEVYRQLALIRAAKSGGPVATYKKALHINHVKKSEKSRKLSDMAFKEALFQGHAHLIQIQLDVDEDLDITKPSQFGRSILYSPQVLGNEACFRTLLGTGRFDPLAKDTQGMTLLFQAAASGKLSICRILLDLEGIDPDANDSGGSTPLSKAAEGGHLEIMKLLLSTGKVNVNSVDVAGFTPLKRAIKFNQTESVKLLLGTEGVDVGAGTARDLTPLQQAAANGMTEVVQLLLAKGFDVNEVYCNNTALTFAASAGREEVVRALLAAEGVWVNPNPPVVIGSPLGIAARRGYTGVVRALIDKGGVALDVPNRNGLTPFLHAVSAGHYEIARDLAQTNLVDVNFFGPESKPALSIAVVRGDLPVVQELLAVPSVNADLEDGSGKTPLDHAAECGRYEIIEELLQREEVANGSALRVENHPYEAAERRNHQNASVALRPWYDRRGASTG